MATPKLMVIGWGWPMEKPKVKLMQTEIEKEKLTEIQMG